MLVGEIRPPVPREHAGGAHWAIGGCWQVSQPIRQMPASSATQASVWCSWVNASRISGALRSGLAMVEQRTASLFQLVHVPAEPGLPDPPHERAVSAVRGGPRTSVQGRGGGVPGDEEVR